MTLDCNCGHGRDAHRHFDGQLWECLRVPCRCDDYAARGAVNTHAIGFTAYLPEDPGLPHGTEY